MLLIFLVFYAVLLYVFTLWVPCSDVGYDFRIKTMFGLFLSQVVCRRAHVLLCFCACLRIVMSNILSYQMSLHSEFRVAMSATISAWERYSVGLFPKLFARLLMSYLCYLCLFVNSNVQHTLTIWVTWRVHWEKHDCLILAAGALRDRDFLILAAGALREAGTAWSWRAPGISPAFGGTRVAHLSVFLYCVFCLFVSVLCLVYTMLPVSLDCAFLIAPSVFSNAYLSLHYTHRLF
jgi:hypothetical protein